MLYADDPQLYITIDSLDQRPALSTFQKCIYEVIACDTGNKLLYNPSKLEVIQCSSRFGKNPILGDFSLANARVQPSDGVCNLGVNLDRATM